MTAFNATDAAFAFLRLWWSKEAQARIGVGSSFIGVGGSDRSEETREAFYRYWLTYVP